MKPEDPNKKYWDFIENFQEKASKECPSGPVGLEALRKVREILEPHWVGSRATLHPLGNKLTVAHELNYVWFCHFAWKLEEARKILGSEHAMARLGIPEEYSSAWAELDWALKIHLAKFPCKFVSRGSKSTPDLLVEINGNAAAVEITSLNLPEEDRIGLDAINFLMMTPMQQNCVARGSLYWVPNKANFEKVKQAATEAIKEAVEKNEEARRNIPGMLTYHVAPEGIANLRPVRWGHFEMGTHTPLPKRDKLVRKIAKKAEQLLSQGRLSVLVVYDRFSSIEEIQQLAEGYNIQTKLRTIPSLAAVILVYPYSTFDRVEFKSEKKDGIISIEYSLQDGEAERCLIWYDPDQKHLEVVEPLVQSLTEFPANLSSSLTRKSLT